MVRNIYLVGISLSLINALAFTRFWRSFYGIEKSDFYFYFFFGVGINLLIAYQLYFNMVDGEYGIPGKAANLLLKHFFNLCGFLLMLGLTYMIWGNLLFGITKF